MMSNLVKKFYRGVAYYALGCVCYNHMGMSLKESDAIRAVAADNCASRRIGWGSGRKPRQPH